LMTNRHLLRIRQPRQPRKGRENNGFHPQKPAGRPSAIHADYPLAVLSRQSESCICRKRHQFT
jgi:hypothetical protein